MKKRDLAELLLLAALWGASFMFMRMAVPHLGPLPVAALRMAGAALLLLPLVALRHEWPALKRHAGAIAVVGIVGSALPFTLFGTAALGLGTGPMSIINATTPMWGALIMWGWMGEKLGAARIVGLLLGVAGVAGLAWDHAKPASGAQAISPIVAIGACMAAALCYGFIAAFTRKRLIGVAPMAVAGGSQMAGAVALALPAAWTAPSAWPPAGVWGSVAALALLCTGLAYLLYFRLIAHIGATNATTVTFLIPLFALLWGTLLLSEPITPAMVLACALILLGTGLSIGLLRWSTPDRGRNP